jgi:hypothetical protein
LFRAQPAHFRVTISFSHKREVWTCEWKYKNLFQGPRGWDVWKQSRFVPLRPWIDRGVWFRRKSQICPWRVTSSSFQLEGVCEASMILKASLFLTWKALKTKSARSFETWVSAYKIPPHHNPEDHNPSMRDLFVINFICHWCNFSIGANENYLIGYNCMSEHTERRNI